MTFSEYTDALNRAVVLLESERKANALRIVSDTMALLKRRIINERVDDKGLEFGTYSDADVPFWFFRGKETKGDNAARVDELYKKHGYWASYQDWREVNNLLGDKINFSFTGEMWKSLIPVVVTDETGKVTIGIIADDDSSDKKIGYQIARFKHMLNLNEMEMKMVQDANNRRIQNALKQVGLL